MAKNEKIRIGLIGAGGNVRARHMPGFLQQQDLEFVAVANRSLASSEAAAKEFKVARAYADWTQVIADPDVDAVCIGTWPYLHAQTTIAALDAGKHVLCEARMAMNAGEAHEMLAASRRNPSCIAQIVPAPHSLAVDRTIMDAVSAGQIGDITAAEVRVNAGGYPDREGPLHWRHNRDLSGNNIMILGIWYECMLRWTGPASTAFATGQVVVKHRRDEEGRRVAISIPDHVDVSGYLTAGGQYRLTVSSVIGHTPARSEAYLYGTEGTIAYVVDNEGKTHLSIGKRGEKAMSPLAIEESKRGGWRVEEEFINAIRGKEQVTHTDFVTAVKYMEWTDAVTQSLQTRCEVALPL